MCGENLMKKINSIVGSISGVMYVIAGIALTAMVALTVADVILRIFKAPIVGTYEIVGLLGGIMVGFAIPQTSRAKGHVAMDVLEGKLPAALDRIFSVITRILGIVLFIIIGWQLWLLGTDYYRIGEVTLTVHLPQFPVCYGIAICCFFECVVLLLEIFQPKQQEEQS
jgi:TRAP-type C4-dicarboxylate transport system permease small subunit